MSNFTDTVSNKFYETAVSHSMFTDVDKVIVGFSGGADSVCLLHLLHRFQNEFSYSLTAVHINHGIRGDEARRDADFAESFCEEGGIPFKLVQIECVKLAEENKISLEEAGREARYKAFNGLCTDKSIIATAHNQNDNAETLIFNLSRGSSLKGACGIPYVRNNIVRPILDCSREEIEGYCKENNLLFVTDSTNLSNDYSRNKIRHNILPVMTELNSDSLNKITRFCNDCADIESFLDNYCNNLLNEATISENYYDAGFISTLEKPIATRVLISAFNRFSTITLERHQILALLELLSSGGRTQIKGDIFAEVKQSKLRFFNSINEDKTKTLDNLKIPFEVVFNKYTINCELIDCSKKINRLSSDNLIDFDKIDGKLFLRSRVSGDKITLRKRNVTKSLKKLFCEENIPLELRDSIPVLCDENGVVWVYGFGVNKRCEVTSNSNNIITVRGKYNDR